MTDQQLFCASSDAAARMSDAEFWERVAASLQGTTVEEAEAMHDFYDPNDTLPDFWLAACPLCHAEGACGYDDEGRPMIHCLGEDDE